MSNNGKFIQSKRTFLKTGLASVALSAPFVNRAWAETTELTMLGWYGTAEPDMVGAPERTRQLYGRVLPIHLERAGMRGDALID